MGLVKSMILDILVLGLEISARANSFSILFCKKVIFNNCLYIYMQRIQMMFQQYCLCMSDFINMYFTDMLNVGFLLNLLRDMRRSFY